MLKIGHRGAKGYVAENTLASFQKAIDLGCDGIELDVQCCKSGKIVVIHDFTIDRTTLGTGFVKDLTLAELKKYKIPTLEDVLDLINNHLIVNIELKSNDCVEKVMKIINQYIEFKNWSPTNFLISSFDWDNLDKITQYNHYEVKTGVITENSIEKALRFAKIINAFAIIPNYKLLNQESVTLLKENGFKIFTWTVNEIADIEKMKSLNVDGIISDFLDRI